MPIFTIGHSNHPLDTFLDLLRLHQIEVLVDVRSQPRSRYVPHFNPENIKGSLKEHGFQYIYMGKELGGRPEGAEFYDEAGHVRYDRVAQASLFLAGLERLIAGGGRYRVAMMCSEEDPTHCHRRLLIGRVLRTRDVPFLHIRGTGALQTEDEVAQAERTPEEAAGQMGLFPAEEITDWKSIRSVSPKKPPPSSSR